MAPRTTRTSHSNKSSRPLVWFIHPDLGIGGAERLVVDAAIALSQGVGQSSNQTMDVKIFTSHHDRKHCFVETIDMLDVQVIGDWLPQSIFGKAKIVFAILRSIYLSIYLTIQLLNHSIKRPDAIIIDQLSVSVPIFSLLNRIPVLFYCHFPDLKLASHDSSVRRLYRAPFDWIEGWTTGCANMLMVNSLFTLDVFKQTFPNTYANQQPRVVYPSIKFDNYQSLDLKSLDKQSLNEIQPLLDLDQSIKLFVSINRFERKKNIGLAIRAFAGLTKSLKQSINQTNKCKLIVAGGYDPINPENVSHLPELERLCLELGLTYSRYPDVTSQVVFLPSFSNTQRQALLDLSLAIVYTPENEHFGIVPIEAMYAKRIALACNSGGPVESIEHNKTGFLCQPTPESFENAMMSCFNLSFDEARKMGEAGRARVINKFSEEAFGKAFYNAVIELPRLRSWPVDLRLILMALMILLFVILRSGMGKLV